MTLLTPEQIQGWLQLGLGGIMLMALFLGHRRVWVFGSFYTDMVADRDRWRNAAMKGVGLAEKGADATAAALAKTNGNGEGVR